MDYIIETEKKVPVAYDVDVTVAGSGIAGTIAAITAARYGAKTVVVDRFGYPGGNIGPGMWAGGSLHLALTPHPEWKADHDTLLNRKGMGGIPEEFCKRVVYNRFDADEITSEQRDELERMHYNVDGFRLGAAGYLTDSLVCSYVAFKMMEEAGVYMLFSAYVSDPIMEGNKVRGVFVETKSGRLAIKSKVVIDATGEADVAFRAGAPVRYVKNPNLGLCFVIENVDLEEYKLFLKKDSKPCDDDIAWANKTLPYEKDRNNTPDPHISIYPLLSFIRKVWESGEFEYYKRIGQCIIRPAVKFGKNNTVTGRTGTSGEVNFSDAFTVSLTERTHREYAFEFARFMRSYIPGFMNSYLKVVAPFLGARGGRTIDMERDVTSQDLLNQQRFDDVIYIYYDDKKSSNCDVPYRMMLPKKIDGLLAVGRSGMIYGPNLRARWSVMLDGQAAGIAASLCARGNIEPRNLDVKKLQSALIKAGCPLGDEKRIEALGLT